MPSFGIQLEMHDSSELHQLKDKRGNYQQLKGRKAGSEIEEEPLFK